MIVMIDNYDSFTYNLVQEMGKLGAAIEVYRNDTISISELEELKPKAIIISPGPCTPTEAGISIEVILNYSGKLPLLGVCLGHQSIIQAFGGAIIHANHIMHGKTSEVSHDGTGLFRNMTNPLIAGRYHSLVGDRQTLPECLEVTAESDDGEIMAIKHKEHSTLGVQFHPESVLTPDGNILMQNFIDMIA